MTYTTETTSQVEFADYIATERSRLASRKQSIVDQQHQLTSELTAIDSELRAIVAYESAKTGKTSRSKSNGATHTRSPRNGSKRTEILNVVTANVDGMSRGDILNALGVKGDKSGEMSVSNALTALTKTQQLVRENGHYFAAQAA